MSAAKGLASFFACVLVLPPTPSSSPRALPPPHPQAQDQLASGGFYLSTQCYALKLTALQKAFNATGMQGEEQTELLLHGNHGRVRLRGGRGHPIVRLSLRLMSNS